MRLLCVVLVLLVPSSTPGTDWTVVQPQVAASLVRVSTLRAGEDDPGTCSGIVFTREYVLTAGHCVAEKAAYTVGERHASLVVTNDILDLAVLKVDRMPKGVVVARFADQPPVAGQTVLVAGYGFGLPNLLVQAGIVANPYEPECKCLLLNADVLFGDSGGGLFDSAGQVVGLVNALRSRGPTHLGMVVPVDVVREFIAPYVGQK